MVAIVSGTKGDRIEGRVDEESRDVVKGATLFVLACRKFSALNNNRRYAGDLPHELRLSAGVLRKAGGGALLVTCLREAISLWIEQLLGRARGVNLEEDSRLQGISSQSAPVPTYR